MKLFGAIVALSLVAACGPAKAPERSVQSTSEAMSPPISAASLQAADFAAYPAQAFTGARRMPNFYGAQSAFRSYRTALGEGAARGPNFAGQYGLVQIGCGADCNETYLIDFATGGVSEVHFSPESGTGVEIKNAMNSALLKTQAFILPATPNGAVRCHYENYVLRNGQLVSLGKADAEGPCPEDQ